MPLISARRSPSLAGALGAWLFAILPAAALAFASLAAAAAPAPSEERWYVVEMMGQRAGWMRARTIADDAAGTIRTESVLELKLARGAISVPIGVTSVFVETAAGVPVSMSSAQKLGALPVSTSFEFKGGEVLVTTEQGGRTSTSTLPAPAAEWMTPGEVRRHVEAQLEAGAEEFSVTTLDAMVGLTPITARYVVEGPVVVEAMGKQIPAIKWRVEQSYMPGVESVEFVDARGEAVRMEMSLGGGINMTLLLSEREVALSKLEPAEIMASTLVHPDRPIKRARESTRASYVLSIPEGRLADIPDQGPQRTERLSERSIRVAVDMANCAPAPEADVADGAFTGRSAIVDAEDPEIVALARKATADAPREPAARAEALRRFVHGHVDSKSLGIGLATASEVCRTREGDCSEHAVLLAAMLRAQGIPSRVASGLLYVDHFLGADEIFGYHMWTQALLEVDGAPRWVDVDATLSGERPSDATHIALACSSLADGDTINSLAVLAPLLGQLEIKVETVE